MFDFLCNSLEKKVKICAKETSRGHTKKVMIEALIEAMLGAMIEAMIEDMIEAMIEAMLGAMIEAMLDASAQFRQKNSLFEII